MNSIEITGCVHLSHNSSLYSALSHHYYQEYIILLLPLDILVAYQWVFVYTCEYIWVSWPQRYTINWNEVNSSINTINVHYFFVFSFRVEAVDPFSSEIMQQLEKSQNEVAALKKQIMQKDQQLLEKDKTVRLIIRLTKK